MVEGLVGGGLQQNDGGGGGVVSVSVSYDGRSLRGVDLGYCGTLVTRQPGLQAGNLRLLKREREKWFI